jgi:hypothetical protein
MLAFQRLEELKIMSRSVSNQGPEDNATVSIRALSAMRKDHDSAMRKDHGSAMRKDHESDMRKDHESDAPATLAHEVELLRAEKSALRHTLDELENLLEQKMQAAQSTYAEQQKQEALLEEKSEEIRELHLQLLEDPATGAAREPGSSPREDELLAMSQELEHERRQLRSDEEALTGQMREMEVQMSRERAELARQRHELQRLHGEVVHELERASRNSGLRERLQPLERRHQEILNRDAARLPRETSVAARLAAIVPATVPPAAQPTAVLPPAAVPRPLAPTVPPAAVPRPLAPTEAEPPTIAATAVAPPVVAAESQPPAPSRPPPADDHDDLLQRLFG